MSSSSSSLLYFSLSTTPLLAVYVYFIFLALNRPRIIAEQYENNDDIDNDMDMGMDMDMDMDMDTSTSVPVSLRTMLNSFLATFIIWCSLALHMLFFVPRRRSLMQKYATDDAYRIIGDVFYNDTSRGYCSRQADIAYITYTLPGDHRIVEKKVRTYHPYHREKVTIVVLPDFPFSGQPLEDIKQDLNSYQRYV
jgi:hypothetical protein